VRGSTKWEDRIRSASEREYQVYHRRTVEERQAIAERQAADGMVDIIKLCAICLSHNLKNITSIISAAFMTTT
jgi:hypothetical protein